MVLGYGATGSAICDILATVGCEVTSASRDAAHRAISRRRGATPVPFADWPGALDGIDVLVNTVPARLVLSDQVMSSLAGITVVDISSPPSGLDHAALGAAGIKVIWARGLGGSRAPVTVGDAQFEYVCRAMASKVEAGNLVKVKGSRTHV
jgi:dipicolinate synthase subunit A